MCGFAGILNLDGSSPNRRLLSRMGQSLDHRGPDGEGLYIDGPLGFAHRRLAIVDKAGSAQPFVTFNQRYTLVSNHEIYNYRELRDSLKQKGVIFQSQGDTEVIGEAFAHDGTDCLEKLVGMFALALWDKKKRTLVLARDRFGIKPLYYFQTNTVFAFASELRALLLHPDCPRQISSLALEKYLAHLAIPEPLTIFDKVHKLAAGHELTVELKRARLKRYARLPSSLEKPISQSELKSLLTTNVELCFQADVPVGIFLSGGVDSSALTIAASQLSSQPVKTFSVKFEEAIFDESRYSRFVAQQLNTDHTEVLFREKDAALCADFLADNIDEPFADASLLPTYFLAQAAKKTVGVVLSGEGADELFGGSPWHWGTGRSAFQKVLREDLQNYLPSDLLFKLDRATMLCSLEARVPFLNHPFANRILHVPHRQLVEKKAGKKALKNYVCQELPKTIVDRPKKGFSIPIDMWLFKNGPFRKLIMDTLLDNPTFANRKQVEGMLRQHDRLENLHGYRLWTLFIFERWLARFHRAGTISRDQSLGYHAYAQRRGLSRRGDRKRLDSRPSLL